MKKETGYPSVDKSHLNCNSFIKNHPMIPGVSIYNALKSLSVFYGKDVAIDCLDLVATNNELLSDAAKLSKGFKELGIKAGDIITVSMPNFYQAVVVYLAANRIGAVTTFLNSYSGEEEIKHYLNFFDSPLFINFDKSKEYNENLKKNTHVKQIITLNKNDLNVKSFAKEENKVLGYSDLLSYKDMGLLGNYYKAPINTLYGGNQDSLILFTSGTTGNPKSVVLTNENIMASGMYMKATCNVKATKGESCLVCVPFTYPYGFATSTLMTLMCGRKAILAPDLSKDNIGYFLSKNPNIIFGSPALLELIKRNVNGGEDLSSSHTFISGGDFLSQSQIEDGKKYFASHGSVMNFCNGSGNAETVATSTSSYGFAAKEGTVGKILTGSDAIIINEETGEELKYDEIGMLCVSGKHVFKEYYNAPELTEKYKFKYKGKTYFKTGTNGKMDKDGNFTLTGRSTRFYIMSTLNKVYCDHIQNAISALDVIDSCAIVKKPDDELLYTAKAYIVLKDGIKPSQEVKEYILELCKKTITMPETNEEVQLKSFEIPTSIEFVEKLPRNTADKLDYVYLEKLTLEEYQYKKINSKNPILEKKN